MKHKKIAVISDLSFKSSGYFNIITPLCDGLGKLGYEIKVAGLGYLGEEHVFDFSIIPAENMGEVATIIQNLKSVWNFDVLLVALDIPLQRAILAKLVGSSRDYQYIGIFPIESDPLSLEWAMSLTQMDKAFVISEFAKKEAEKLHLDVEHLIIGVDPAWRPPTDEEKINLRRAYGIPEDAFVALTVADNQERKNHPIGMKAFARFTEKFPNSRYIVVTRLEFFAGWNLDELARRIGIADKFIPMERGMAFRDLWGVYAMSDALLCLSKAEGLNMTALEGMSVGLPVIGTNCTAHIEHLSDGRGFLVDYLEDKNFDFPPVDPFGLGNRYWASVRHAQITLEKIASGKWKFDREGALEYVRSRTWESAVSQVDRYLKGLENGETQT